MENPQERFQALLRELFQFDCADLDFGIYRIMNRKRALLTEFIERRLPADIRKALGEGALKAQGDLAAKLAELAGKIRDDIDDNAVDADGALDPAQAGTKLGRQYLALQAQAAGARASAESEELVFNHLYQFFSRYYDDGDFVSRRRYSRQEKYAIPYNGEEVVLHWANKDQYYIKTGETFTDYRWTADGTTVLFKLVRAEIEKDNVKAQKKRFFVPRLDEVSVESPADGRHGGRPSSGAVEGLAPSRPACVTIPFEYCPLTEQEEIAHGKKNVQEAIVAQAVESLPRRKALKDAPAALAALMTEYRKTEDGTSVSRLEHHLRRYTRKNTSDYFIHKDLEGFLTRELDFYLKNEVLALDDVLAGDGTPAEGWFQLARAIRAVGAKIAVFLAQIENFQKRIFEKRKFVTETGYCFTLDRVPKKLWPAILKSKAQIDEWKKLYSIQDLKGYSDPLKPAFFDAWPALMVDTRFYDTAFTDDLLAAQPDLDESLGGLLVHSENFQALNLLLPRFREQVKCVFTDPPYNTGVGDFLYRDTFQHSSWLAMMDQTLSIIRPQLQPASAVFVTIDDVEHNNLERICAQVFGSGSFVANVIWQKKYSPQNDATWFSDDHDYVLVVSPDKQNWTPVKLDRTEEQDRAYSNPDNDRRGPWKAGDYTSNKSKEERPNLWYAIKNPHTGDTVYPKAGATWRYEVSQHVQNDAEGRVWWGSSGANRVPAYKRFLSEVSGVVPRTIWPYDEVGHNQDAVRELAALFGCVPFPTPKPVNLVRRSFHIAGPGTCLDCFAGSGTSGHAALRPIAGAGRPYVLVDMGQYFDTVLKPRIQKVIFSSDWKDGKPVLPKVGKSAGLSHGFKYVRLESYEDALGNLGFGEAQGALEFEEYLLRYMLEFETRGSGTLLNVEKLAAPFAYRLEIRDGGEAREKAVDLPETFNWLLGLKVSSRRALDRDGRRYLVIRGTTNPKGEGGEREIAVLWRDVTGWKAADFKAEREWVKAEKLTAGATEVFLNDDHAIEGARVLDPVFKERMFAPVGG
jgi:adenine-specific DNA-methyltransferase